jgi:hypothetical protein
MAWQPTGPDPRDQGRSAAERRAEILATVAGGTPACQSANIFPGERFLSVPVSFLPFFCITDNLPG